MVVVVVVVVVVAFRSHPRTLGEGLTIHSTAYAFFFFFYQALRFTWLTMLSAVPVSLAARDLNRISRYCKETSSTSHLCFVVL